MYAVNPEVTTKVYLKRIVVNKQKIKRNRIKYTQFKKRQEQTKVNQEQKGQVVIDLILTI